MNRIIFTFGIALGLLLAASSSVQADTVTVASEPVWTIQKTFSGNPDDLAACEAHGKDVSKKGNISIYFCEFFGDGIRFLAVLGR